jgi:hypothetical protein
MEPHEAPLSLCSSVHGLPAQHNARSRPPPALLAQLRAALHFHSREEICLFNEPSDCSPLIKHQPDRAE